MAMGNEMESSILVPILPDRIDEARKFWDEISTNRAHEVDEYTRGVGQSRVLSYLQHMSRGDFLAQYIRSDVDIETTFRRNREIGTPIAKYILDAFMSFTGYDFTKPENVPKIEKLYGWGTTEAEGTSRKCYVFGIPLLPGKRDTVRRHFEGRKANNEKAEKTYRDQGILKLGIFLQELRTGPGGQFAIVYIESYDDLSSVLLKIPEETGKFWIDVSGIDFSKPENVPDLELLFEWNAARGVRTAEAQKAYTV